jgi:hypothetical protein
MTFGRPNGAYVLHGQAEDGPYRRPLRGEALRCADPTGEIAGAAADFASA